MFDLLSALINSWKLWNEIAGSDKIGLRWRKRYIQLTYAAGRFPISQCAFRIFFTPLPRTTQNRPDQANRKRSVRRPDPAQVFARYCSGIRDRRYPKDCVGAGTGSKMQSRNRNGYRFCEPRPEPRNPIFLLSTDGGYPRRSARQTLRSADRARS